jgi:hypothetical protein
MTKENPDLLTVIETVCFRPYMDESFVVDSRFSRRLETSEQPYQRLHHKGGAVATEQWKQLDFGWLKENTGMISITNDEGTFYEVNPTEEEREDVEKRVIEVGYQSLNDIQDFVWFVPPGEDFRGSPSHPSRLWIRCQHGEARFTLTVFPK